ncbi:hypothetical protein BABINDRAFT_161420 [Babjeviella inositovora NRRL Y-12698]|uniref:DNA mismatch repair protein MSH3 n=1 Tax=Babjeviella inositovora NRRL Y-12698 TaxID=984486 RepID=A0A1E3QRZ0_9ASCO|nr:uncharacterized protein BABINDRAFT_161420 [Babjeviella inositovora NRRL Y-12698]ODQ79707.1 hypothetical protein BABINDRAFT_161420 [Babjeviella inositovora NRRL Y-12698]
MAKRKSDGKTQPTISRFFQRSSSPVRIPSPPIEVLSGLDGEIQIDGPVEGANVTEISSKRNVPPEEISVELKEFDAMSDGPSTELDPNAANDDPLESNGQVLLLVVSTPEFMEVDDHEYLDMEATESPATVELSRSAKTDSNSLDAYLSKPDCTPAPLNSSLSSRNFAYNRAKRPDPVHTSFHDAFVRKLKTSFFELLAKEKRYQNDEAPSKKEKLAKKLTPMQQQVADLKKANMDKLLVVQLGYKYKMYAQDAVLAARILGFMLIPGKVTVDDSAPGDYQYDAMAYCSFPVERLHINVKRLLGHNLKIGVVEQTETAAIKANTKKSGLFKREITHVYTNATYFDDQLMKGEGGKRDDYVLVVTEVPMSDRVMISLVAVQPLTGEIVYDEFEDTFIRDELQTRLKHLQPGEVILVEVSAKTEKTVRGLESQGTKVEKRGLKMPREGYTNELITYYVDTMRAPEKGKESSSKSQNPTSSEKFTLIHDFLMLLSDSLRICCLELIIYLQEFRLDSAFWVRQNFLPFQNLSHMVLNGSTLTNLEIFQNQTDFTEKGSLLWLLDHTRTAPGARMLRRWISRPLVSREAIENRLQAVQDIMECLSSGGQGFWEALTASMKKIPDLEKALIKVHYGKTSRKELYLLLRGFNELLQLFSKHERQDILVKSDLLSQLLSTLFSASEQETTQELLQMIYSPAAIDDKMTNDDNKHVVQYFNAHYCQWDGIAAQEAEISRVEQLLEAELVKLRVFLRRPSLKYESVLKDSYLIEVRNTNIKTVPHDWLKIGSTKTVSRFRPPEVSRLYKSLQYHREMLISECNSAYVEFMAMVDSHFDYFNGIVRSVATLDCLFSLTAVSSATDYVKPAFVDSQTVDIRQGRNPIVEQLSLSAYVANDIAMASDRTRAMVITGPNMGGKSSYVRQVAILVIMAQIGCYVPAESATMGVFDAILIRMGAQDNLMKGESTFMVEMGECCQILQNATAKSLVILDEVGRGTGTTDGVSLAYSILDYLVDSDVAPLVLFITHYPSLHVFETKYPGLVKNYHMGYVEVPNEDSQWATITFLYTLEPGIVSNSYGLNVARLASIPTEIIDKAYMVSQEMKEMVEGKKARRWCEDMLRVLQAVTKNSDVNIEEVKRLHESMDI